MSRPQPDLEAGVTAAAAMAVGPSPASLTVARRAPRPRWMLAVACESPRLQWAFVRKVYGVIALQFLFAISAVAVPLYVPAIPRFFNTAPHSAAYSVLAVVVAAPFAAVWPLIRCRGKQPANLLLLCLVTDLVSLSISVLLSTYIAYVDTIVLQSVILTEAALISLILCTFWSAMRNDEAGFYILPLLVTTFIFLAVHFTIQGVHPLGNIYLTSWGCLGTVMFSSFIMHQPKQITEHKHDEYVLAAISLYADLIKLRCLR